MAWKRVMAIGCSHGDLCHPVIRGQVLEFKRRFKPQIRFELGDLIDTACFRAGAAGTKDEAKSTRDDKAAAIRWIEEYEPTHISWGNHDWRLWKMSQHPKAMVADLARNIRDEIEAAAAKVHAKTTPYKIKHNWHIIGGVAWGHGFMVNINALRDHAEMLGMPVVMAHLHRPHSFPGRTLTDTHSFCVGAMADEELLEYADTRRASLDHGHGIVFGEVSDIGARLHLIRSLNGEPLPIPSWI